jgi:radical SAM protein with 4Fe4S-binding SPASM domain
VRNHLNIKDYDEYIAFNIETTANCNLRCSYCYFDKSGASPEYSVDTLVEALKPYPKVELCFFGGEPFMNPVFMEAVMTHPEIAAKNVLYSSNTNGTCFQTLRPELLKKFAFHFVSVDGYADRHDSFRGVGVFRKVLESIAWLRQHSDAALIARMTVSDSKQLSDIPRLTDSFDAAYWQLNNTVEELPDRFLETYLVQLRNLFDYWKKQIFSNKSFTIIPFVGMCDLILTGGMDRPGLLCGVGTCQYHIAVDGSMYLCPETRHRHGDLEKIGTLESFKEAEQPVKNRCLRCDIFKFCGGRCAMTNDDIYCEGIFEIYNLLAAFLDSLDQASRHKLEKIIDLQKMLTHTSEITP